MATSNALIRRPHSDVPCIEQPRNASCPIFFSSSFFKPLDNAHIMYWTSNFAEILSINLHILVSNTIIPFLMNNFVKHICKLVVCIFSFKPLVFIFFLIYPIPSISFNVWEAVSESLICMKYN